MKKHIFTLFAALCLCLALLPTAALADGNVVSSATDLETAIKNGGEYELQNIIAEVSPMTVEKDVTLDLYGNTITTDYFRPQEDGSHQSISGHLFTVKNGAKLTIKDSSDNHTGEIYANFGAGGNAVIYVEKGGSVVVSGGTISGAVTNSNGGTVNITGGTVSGAVTNNATLTISGGEISGTVANTGTLNANGGTISGAVTNSGTITRNITGPDIDTYTTFSGTVSGNGTIDTKACPYNVMFYDCPSAPAQQFVLRGQKATKPADPTKDGDTFVCWYSGADSEKKPYDFETVLDGNLQLHAKWDASLSGSGSTEHTHNWASAWSYDDTHHWHECSASDCTVTDNSQKDGYAVHSYGTDGKCDYCGSSLVACITKGTGNDATTAFYATFNAAYEAAQSGDTITLLADAEYDTSKYSTSRSTWRKSLTVDLNEHTLKATYGGADYVLQLDCERDESNGQLPTSYTFKNGTFTGGMTVSYATLNLDEGFKLWNNDPRTLTLCAGTTLNVSSDIEVQKLLVDSSGATCKLTGGTFGTIECSYANGTVADLLPEGYGFKATIDSQIMWFDSTSTDTEVYNVEVKKLPITSVTLAADRTAAEGQTYPTYPYSDSYDNGSVITTIVQPADGNELKCEYYVDDRSTDHFCTTNAATDTNTYSLSEMTVNGQHLSVGEHTIYVKATKDGYTLQSNTVTVEIAKATLTEDDYTAPTAKSGLTFNGNQQLINKGSVNNDISGPTFWYGKENEYSEMEWGTGIPIGYDAGTYTVYWYIEGGANYQSVGSTGHPADEIEVTIARKEVTPSIVFDNNNQTSYTYTGSEIKPTFTLYDGDTVIPASGYTVSYSGNTNVCNNAQVTVTCKDGGNYSFNAVSRPFAITKAAAPTVTGTKTYEIVYSDTTPHYISISDFTGLEGWPTNIQNPHLDSYYYTLYMNSIISFENDGVGDDIKYTLSNGLTSDKVNTVCEVTVKIKSDNYEIFQVNATVKLTDKVQKPLTVNMEGWTYGDTPKAPQFSKPDGVEAQIKYQLQSSPTSGPGSVDNSISSDAKAGTWKVYVKYETDTEIWGGTADFTISPKDIKDVTITLDKDTFTYNGNDQKPNVLSVKDGDKTLVERTGTQTDQPDYTVSCTEQKNAGDYVVTITGEGNYTGTATKTWSIGKQSLYAKSVVTPKVYDGNTVAEVTINFDLPANEYKIVAGDSVTVTGVTGTFDNKNVGTGKTVTIDSSNAVVSGKNSENYQIIYPGTNDGGVITAKPVTATVTVADKTYDGTKTATVTARVESGLIAGDEIIISGLFGVFDNANVGNDKMVYIDSNNRVISGNDSQNYEVEIVGTASGNITPATPTGEPKYTAITTSGKTLADAALTVNDSWPAGTVKWVDANGNPLADTTAVAANTSYNWKFTPDSSNYNAISGTITLWNYTPSTSSDSSSDRTTITVPVSSDRATVNVEATVSKGNATVEVSDKQIEKVAADGAGTVTVDVSGLKNVDSATVPSHVMEKTNEAEDTGLTVALPTGSVALDETALESVTDNANGKDVTISVETVSVSKLSTAVKNAIGMDNSVVAVVDVNITVGKVKQSSFDGGKITVSIPYTPKKGEDTGKLTVWFIRDDGTIEKKGGWYDAKNKCFVFETDHLSQYLLVNVGEAKAFTDVPADAYFAGAVTWAAGNGITGGTTDTTFSPYNSCTRAQIVTFLWRAAGQPEPTTQSSFSDVSAGAYYAKAVAWAVENGITNGFADGTFGVNTPCTRAQAVTFLFRYAAANGMDFVTLQELVSGYSDAADVPGYALSAFNWALAGGIVTGNDGALMPNGTCTRAQIVTFLYRLLGN